MLKNWRSHLDYQSFLKSQISLLSPVEIKRLNYYKSSIDKLTALNLDTLHDALAPYYSNTGRPALLQPEIFRSFILMLDQNITSITKWVELLASDSCFAIMIGCTTDNVPSLGAHYDFINRLWLRKQEPYESKKLYSYNKNHSKAKKPKNNTKLPNKRPGVTKRIKDYFLSGRSFSSRYERLLQEIFTLIAVEPSLELGLISTDKLTLAGDGTALHCHSNHYGSKVCKCRENGIYNCKCDRRFPDPDANIGWDSDLNTWYYGYTLYALSVYNPDYKIDLPVYLRFVGANRHDSVTGIVALAEFRELNPKLEIHNLCLDSANDNYPTYDLCKAWNINPFIDLNHKRGANNKYPAHLSINENGVPVCIGKHEMVYNGYCKGRSRHKWRCPLKCGKVEECSSKELCSPSPYGRVIYTKPDWDIRLFTPVPRGTTTFKNIYKTRTAAERINNRILNDYNLQHIRIRTKKRFAFFTMMASINIHLDARIKVANLNNS